MTTKIENRVRYKYRGTTLLTYSYLEKLEQKRYKKIIKAPTIYISH